MIELFVLAVVAFVVFAVFVTFTAFAVLLRAVFWVLLLPLRLVFWLLLLPFLLLKAVIGGVLFLVWPLLAIVGVILALALAVPLAPLLVVGFLVWMLIRAGSRPALVRQ